jgi:RNA ligase (TIGR02306 family)
MRKLATIRKIGEVKVHSNADKLGLYIIDGWQVIDQKDRYSAGNQVIYCEIDCFMPIKEEYEFLRRSSYKKMGVHEGFRLKTLRLRGELSQGLILPLSYLPEKEYTIGEEVTEQLGIVKYEPPVPENLAGDVLGVFPGYIPKTDEERVQNLEYEALKKYTYTVTEKVDGSSCTIYLSEDRFGVCSRNLELKETQGNALWNAARKLNIEEILTAEKKNFALQGEMIGFRIQSNPYKLNHVEFRLFKIYDIDKKDFMPIEEMKNWADAHGILTVPILDYAYTLPEHVFDFLKYADGKSKLNEQATREGVVLHANEQPSVHFKGISNIYLEGED